MSTLEHQQLQDGEVLNEKNKKTDTRKNYNSPHLDVDAGNCFVCQGSGHWARECTSLPSMYLTEDAPRCYRCNGLGHFARFCPTSEKKWRQRIRRGPSHILPNMWSIPYFAPNDYFAYPASDQITDQLLLVKPEYSNKRLQTDEHSFTTTDNCRYNTESDHIYGNIDDYANEEDDEDDVSVVEYTIVDNLNALDALTSTINHNMVESTVETA